MKKVVALMMAGVIAFSTPMMVVHAESNGEWNLEDELTINEGEEDNVTNEEDLDEPDEEILIATSQWANKDSTGKGHSTLPLCVMDSFSNLPAKKQDLIKQCLLFGSENADKKVLHDSSARKTQLYGFGNYILYLNALWLYARKISVKNQTDAMCREQIINELSVKNSDEWERLNILLQIIPEIYTLYKQKYGTKPTNFEKQYLVLGLALHLIGDIYAHRTLVTIEIADRMIGDGVFKKSDFGKKYNKFKKDVVNGDVNCANIDEYLEKENGNNMKFEDNTEFLPNRYKYSKSTAKKFISNYVISGSSFNANYIKQHASDWITLDKFDKYK